jgi:hypothetical protein
MKGARSEGEPLEDIVLARNGVTRFNCLTPVRAELRRRSCLRTASQLAVRLPPPQRARNNRETIKSGDQAIEIARIMITDAGRRALEALHWPEAQ